MAESTIDEVAASAPAAGAEVVPDAAEPSSPAADEASPRAQSPSIPTRGRRSAAGALAQPLERAIVAAGRTVVLDGRDYGPGREVELTAAEIARLRAHGALFDPDRPAPPRSSGAVYAKR